MPGSKRSCRLRRFRNNLALNTLVRNSVALGVLAVAIVAVGLPALGQEKPESILPPGFGEPAPQNAPTPSPTSSAPRPILPPPDVAPGPSRLPGAEPATVPNEEAGKPVPIDPKLLAEYELPAYARRLLAVVGVVDQSQGGLGRDAFGRADGRFLETLMGRLNAPIASRWLSIGLRRALASQVATPIGTNGADFAAERAWLLLRMGESIVSRALVERVDAESSTPKMYEAAMQAALATGDPALVCPVVVPARLVSRDRAWIVARAICAGLSGVPGESGPLITAARRSGVARGIDLLLAEKVAGAGAKGQQAVTIEWQGVDELSIWRYGLATATNVEIPEALLASARPQVHYWRAQSPGIEPRLRVPGAEMAAAQGVFSNAALVDLFGQVDQADDSSSAEAGIARDLRTAYIEPDRIQRLAILRQLWDEPKTRRGHYARLVLTARACTALPPKADTAEADSLIASMLSAGLFLPASRWRDVVARGSDGWAMLALADPAGGRMSRNDVDAYRSRATDPTGVKARMLLAGLAGLGLLDQATSEALGGTIGVDLARTNNWTRALDRAAASGQQGTVLLIAAIGMQTADWRGVSPEALYQIVAALHRVGLDPEARMIAVEALTRL